MAGHGHIPSWLRVAFAQVFVAGVLLPTAALAQLLPPTVVPAQAGNYLTPSLSVAEVYDDNVFFPPSPRRPVFLPRTSPGLTPGYQSAPLPVWGSSPFASETSGRHPGWRPPLLGRGGLFKWRAPPIQVLPLQAPGLT